MKFIRVQKMDDEAIIYLNTDYIIYFEPSFIYPKSRTDIQTKDGVFTINIPFEAFVELLKNEIRKTND